MLPADKTAYVMTPLSLEQIREV